MKFFPYIKWGFGIYLVIKEYFKMSFSFFINFIPRPKLPTSGYIS